MGGQDDLRKVTQCTYAQIVQLRMSEKLAQVSFDFPWPGEALVERPFSEAMAQLIDKEVQRLIGSASAHTLDLLTHCRRAGGQGGQAATGEGVGVGRHGGAARAAAVGQEDHL
ncbi:hypothetical protein MG293_020335 [Ovis ammon polii]|uniref:Peptidase M41 domain-containing protein n=1 Tax=Ovis ammon polii TaxID=230172 RepID=A0AAD4TN95_OVIAM|nr:hypothetical protein MG293_020335 [Ovis ammon polii]